MSSSYSSHQLVDVRSRFTSQLCFFDRMTGLKALRRLCRCGGKDFLQPIPLCHLCTTQAFSIGQLELLLIPLLALPTGGPCTVSAVNAAAAHHPRLDRAQIMSAFLEQVLTAFNHVRRWKSPTKLRTRFIHYFFRSSRADNRFVA
jgi:hypothetical protein